MNLMEKVQCHKNTEQVMRSAFLHWLEAQDDDIRTAIDCTHLEQDSAFTIRHGSIQIQATIDNRGIDIFVERNGICWDILLSLVVVPAPVQGGYHCLACLQNERRVFADVQTLWRNHLFGPLLGWMRRKLFRADRLCLYSSRGATWARLLRPSDQSDDADVIVDG